MAKVELKTSSVMLTDSVRASFDEYIGENTYAASIYVYRTYTVKAVGTDYVDIELSDQIRWTETASEPGSSYSYYEWEIGVPVGTYVVIGNNYGSPDGPDTLTVRVYKNIANGSPGVGSDGYVYVVTSGFSGSASYTEDIGDDYEYIGFNCWISSNGTAYAAYAVVSAGDAVCVGGVVRDASPVVCVGGVIRGASSAKCVGGVVKT